MDSPNGYRAIPMGKAYEVLDQWKNYYQSFYYVLCKREPKKSTKYGRGGKVGAKATIVMSSTRCNVI
jgi:hypothetical protein